MSFKIVKKNVLILICNQIIDNFLTGIRLFTKWSQNGKNSFRHKPYLKGRLTLKSYLFISFFVNSLFQNNNILHIISAQCQERQIFLNLE